MPEEKEAAAPSELKEDPPAPAEKDATAKVEEKDESPPSILYRWPKTRPRMSRRRNAHRGQSWRSRGRRPSCSPDGPARGCVPPERARKISPSMKSWTRRRRWISPTILSASWSKSRGTPTKVSVRLDTQALTDAGLAGDSRLQFVGNHRLADSLSMICENLNGTQLAHDVDRGVLTITTAEKKDSTIRLRFYDLSGCEIENLTTAVQNYAQQLSSPPESITSLGDSLAIRALLTTHDEIEEFISGAIRLADARRETGSRNQSCRSNSRPLDNLAVVVAAAADSSASRPGSKFPV